MCASCRVCIIYVAMQDRHLDRKRYFEELAATSRTYFVPQLRACMNIGPGVKVLEIGCGDGGNLLPFAEAGCEVTGIDIAAVRVDDAGRFFAERGAKGRFLHTDVFTRPDLGGEFDIVLCHDVYEHVPDKKGLLSVIAGYLKPEGIAYVAFPAWQMPFGGHQQICRHRIASKLPYVHLLPRALYRGLLRAFGEGPDCVNEQMSIKGTKTSVEAFERAVKGVPELAVMRRELWFINPHYEVKFGLRARRLNKVVARIPWVRNFVSTSCEYFMQRAKGS